MDLIGNIGCGSLQGYPSKTHLQVFLLRRIYYSILSVYLQMFYFPILSNETLMRKVEVILNTPLYQQVFSELFLDYFYYILIVRQHYQTLKTLVYQSLIQIVCVSHYLLHLFKVNIVKMAKHPQILPLLSLK